MAEALEEIVGAENISAGIVNCNHKNSKHKILKTKVIEASHPLPDNRGINGVKEMLQLKESYSINEYDLVLCLISGGGPALLPCPVEDISLDDKSKITSLLLKCGAEIGEINTVRKHLSKVKGGGLGRFFYPATVVSLILSDVIGNKLDVIASGLTFPSSTTFWDAYNVLEKYSLISVAPRSIVEFLREGYQGKIEAKPSILDNCHNFIIGDNRVALRAMENKAIAMELSPYIITSEQEGDTNNVAISRAQEILNNKYIGHNVLLVGGETTPILPHDFGQGGRNQHYAIVSMLAMQEYKGEWVIASLGTDGSDFLPNVAGAIIDNTSLNNVISQGINVESYIQRYDSYSLLNKIGRSIIVTGHTGTNVGDIVLYALN